MPRAISAPCNKGRPMQRVFRKRQVPGTMYAIIETGGKQYRVSEGDILFIEKLNAEADSTVEFDRVIAAGNDGDLKFGTLREPRLQLR